MPDPSQIGDIVRAIDDNTRAYVVGVLKSVAKIVIVELNSGNESDREIHCSAIVKQLSRDEIPSEWLPALDRIQRMLLGAAPAHVSVAESQPPAIPST
jgi:hypothetical protein